MATAGGEPLSAVILAGPDALARRKAPPSLFECRCGFLQRRGPTRDLKLSLGSMMRQDVRWTCMLLAGIWAGEGGGTVPFAARGLPFFRHAAGCGITLPGCSCRGKQRLATASRACHERSVDEEEAAIEIARCKCHANTGPTLLRKTLRLRGGEPRPWEQAKVNHHPQTSNPTPYA